MVTYKRAFKNRTKIIFKLLKVTSRFNDINVNDIILRESFRLSSRKVYVRLFRFLRVDLVLNFLISRPFRDRVNSCSGQYMKYLRTWIMANTTYGYQIRVLVVSRYLKDTKQLKDRYVEIKSPPIFDWPGGSHAFWNGYCENRVTI